MAPTYRHKLFAPYQSGRKFDDALVEQLAILPEFVSACGFGQMEERRKGNTPVASGDRDAYQLASARTTILFPAGRGILDRIEPIEVRERYGVEPSQVPDFIALRGDPSDKLPGAPGVGPKGAADILRRYGPLEAALKAERFPANADALRIYRSIATMNSNAPLPPLRSQKPTWKRQQSWRKSLA